MSGKNPYQLKSIGGGDKSLNSSLHKPLTEDEQREKLVGYANIPKDAWIFLRSGNHIRYITTDGDFNTGGFVASNSINDAEKGRRIKIKTSLFKDNSGYKEYLVNYSDIEFLYCKLSATEFTLQKDIHTLAEMIAKMIAEMKK
jgi:hypothetical protein